MTTRTSRAHHTQMRTSDFDFDLPEDLIALRPVTPRDASRLLVVDPNDTTPLTDATVRNLPDYMRSDDVLVLNDTRVIPAALKGERHRNGAVAGVHFNLVRRDDRATWQTFAKPGRKLKVGDRVVFPTGPAGPSSVPSDAFGATVTDKRDGGLVTIRFDHTGAELDEAIARSGAMPLPPYIEARRPADRDDDATYQTVYAAHDGAVASPTAGLHFTSELFAALE
ncbi:MAG: S-adenosylmethionine:tRNA ribosyltransferase-isomerase, partial [Pseudomonadota bacterium]